MGETAEGIAAAGGWVWLALARGALLKIDPSTNQVVGSPIPYVPKGTPDSYADLSFGAGALWAMHGGAGVLIKADPVSGAVLATRKIPPVIRDLWADSGAVWLVRAPEGPTDPQLLQIDPDTLRDVRKPVTVGELPVAVEASDDAIWVLSSTAGLVTRVDRATGKTRSIMAASQPLGGHLINGGWWSVHPPAGTVTRVDAATLAVDRVVHTGGAPVRAYAAFGSLWVIDGGTSSP